MIHIDIQKMLHGSNGDMPLDIKIDIKEGEFVALSGISGSGKTTLLQILAGLETPTQGSIFYNDINLSENCLEKFNVMRNELFGYAYQFHYLLDDLTVYENCELVFRISNNKNYGDRTNRILDVLNSIEWKGSDWDGLSDDIPF